MIDEPKERVYSAINNLGHPTTLASYYVIETARREPSKWFSRAELRLAFREEDVRGICLSLVSLGIFEVDKAGNYKYNPGCSACRNTPLRAGLEVFFSEVERGKIIPCWDLLYSPSFLEAYGRGLKSAAA